MKKVFLNFILLLFAALCLTSCSDDEVPVPKPLHASGSRSIIADGFEISTSNPSLLKNWETVNTIYIANGSHQLDKITPPWISGSTTNLPAEFFTDIKKEDGWTMLFHTLKDEVTDPEQSYMVFYNLFTGVLKVFYYYNKNDFATNSQWVFKCNRKNGDRTFKMFYVPTYLSKADNDTSIIKDTGVVLSNNINIENSALGSGWNGFEYKVAQYSKEDLNENFLISAQSSLSSFVKYEGFIMNDISGKINSVTVPETMGKNNASKLINSVANMGGEAGKEYITGLFEHSNSNGSNTGTDDDFRGKLLGSLKNLAGNVAKDGISALIKKGLGILFGQTSTVTVQKTVSDVNLTAEGSVTLKGVTDTNIASGIKPLSFNFGEILNGTSSSSINPNIVYSTSSNSTNKKLSNLGVWCIKNKPVIYFDLVKPFYLEESTDLESYDPLEVSGKTILPTVKYSNIDVIFNPAVQQYITSYTVDKMFFCASLKGHQYSFANFGANPSNSNLAYKEDSRTIYTMPAWGSTQHIRMLCDIVSNEVTAGSQFYYKWRMPTNCEMLALVTVTMNINYMGKERTITESRIFEADAVEQLSMIRHNPPYSVILNNNYIGWRY